MQDCKLALFVLGLEWMRNLIIGISVLFVAIISVSYFYFSNLDERGAVLLAPAAAEQVEAAPAEPAASSDALWAFELNGVAISQPSVHRYTASTHVILVQAAYHTVHAVSPDGEKLWNAQLPGPIVDSISQRPD